MTTLYLGCPGSYLGNIFAGWDHESFPVDMLVAYPDLKSFRKTMEKAEPMGFRLHKRFLDSGAFSAFNSGKVIDHDALMAEQRKPGWDDIASLDVIGDWQASKANWEKERAAGVVTMPTFHIGDPWDLLAYYKANAPKVALGGIAPLQPKHRNPWLKQVFARAWPHKFHAFGVMREDILRELPFHSCDSTVWWYGVVRGGAYCLPTGGLILGGKADTAKRLQQVSHMARRFINLSKELNHRWSRAFAEIPSINKEAPCPPSP